MKVKLKNKGYLIRLIALALSVTGIVALLALTAFAQNTYVITDGDRVTVHTSFTEDPAKVLDEVGVELAALDFYTTEAVDGVSEITVQRAMPVTIDNCGEQVQATSYGESLETLLDRLGIASGDGRQISLPLDTMTYEGMEVTVTRIVESTETYTVEIPFETTYCEDPTLPLGEEKILVEGQNGQMLRQADVVYRNTSEQSRTVQQETVLNQPVNQIVAVGTGENVGGKAQPVFGDGFIVLPTGEVLTYTHTDQYVATAYTMYDDGCDSTTATGSQVRLGVVAVDPTVIPYGTRMFIVSNDGEYIYGIGTAEDCGSGIEGKRLDLFMHTLDEAFTFGRRSCTVYFLGDANWQ